MKRLFSVPGPAKDLLITVTSQLNNPQKYPQARTVTVLLWIHLAFSGNH